MTTPITVPADHPATNQDVHAFAEQRVNSTALVPPFQPGQDITAWIKQFHLAAKALGMNNE